MNPKAASDPIAPSVAVFPNQRLYKPCMALLAAMYLAGLIGMQMPLLQPYFLQLVPFHLISSAIVLLLFHHTWNRDFLIFCAVTCLAGYGVEVVGVQTGLIFGHYAYGPTLGFQWFDVPIVIGVNWLVLIYCTGTISARVPVDWWKQALIGATLMVMLDFFIEPVAIQFYFWHWNEEFIPMQNYVAWFIISFALVSFFLLMSFQKKNKIALFLYIVQLLFFILHNLLF